MGIGTTKLDITDKTGRTLTFDPHPLCERKVGQGVLGSSPRLPLPSVLPSTSPPSSSRSLSSTYGQTLPPRFRLCLRPHLPSVLRPDGFSGPGSTEPPNLVSRNTSSGTHQPLAPTLCVPLPSLTDKHRLVVLSRETETPETVVTVPLPTDPVLGWSRGHESLDPGVFTRTGVKCVFLCLRSSSPYGLLPVKLLRHT